MPGLQGRWADQEAEPARPRQALTETGEQEAISRPPTRPLDLPLEDAELVPESQELKSELGLRATPLD